MGSGKERNGCITAWLWLAIITNLVLAVYCAISMFSAYTGRLAWALGIGSVLSVVNILGAVMLMRWNKIGFYILTVSAVLSIGVNMMMLGSNPVELVGSVVAILIWWAILQVKKNGESAWSQMESGWDVAHCRHLYQVFCGIIVLLIALTALAASKNSGESPVEKDDIEISVNDGQDSTAVNDIIVVEESIAVVPEEEEPRVEKTPESASEKAPAKPSEKTPAPEKAKPGHSAAPKEDGSSSGYTSDQLLKEGIAWANNNMIPMNAGSGIVITRIYLSGNYVTYVAECDEDIIDMSLISPNKSAVLNELRKNKSDPQIAQFLRLCVNAGKGVAYRYIGDTSGTKVSLFISNAELKTIF